MKLHLILTYYLLFFLGCASPRQTFLSYKMKLMNGGNYFVVGCEIYDLNGLLVTSYPGHDCLFLEDGSYLSYDGAKMKLRKYDHRMALQWSLDMHVHHSLKLTREGDYLINSSVVKPFKGIERVRFDEVVLIDSDGKIKQKFLFHQDMFDGDYLSKTDWDKNLEFTHEISRVCSSYQVERPIVRGPEVFAPAGSFLVTSNSGPAHGIFVLDKNMTKILKKITPDEISIIHDVQAMSSREILFLNNDVFDFNRKRIFMSRVVIFDVFTGKRVTTPRMFPAVFSGGVQAITDDLFLVKDSGSKYGAISLVPKSNSPHDTAMNEEHMKRKGRLVFYSFEDGILDELHFDKKFHHGKVQNLRGFLSKSIRL